MCLAGRGLLGSIFLLALLLAPLCSPAQSPAQPAPPSPASVIAAPAQNSAPAYTLSADKLARAIALTRIRNILDIASSLWGILFLWILLALRGWARLEAWAQRRSSHRWLQGTYFFLAFFLLTWLAALPLAMIGHHYERSYQISVEGWSVWLFDEAKALGVTLLLGTPLLLLFHWIVRTWPRRYWFGAWLVTLPLLVLLIFVEPLAEPLFNQYEPLSRNHAELVQKLEKVVDRTGTNIPPDRMFLMLASEKTNGLNAYVTGIGPTKRIVVWDNTAGRIPDDEILFIFAHETGHYVLNHIPKMIAGFAAGLFFIYWGCAAFSAWLIRHRGARWGAPSSASLTGFVVLVFSVSIAAFLLEPAGNAFSRHFEHQADVYGQEAVHGIVPDPQKTAVAAFNDLGKAWLDDPNPSPFIEFWLNTHPSTQARAQFALHYNPWAGGGHGKYFPH
jgi:STE24 endopeptidase